jgi:hypothetical protein
MLDCGEIVAVVQYFQHDLFRSIVRTLNFQKLFVVHQHYGRHSGVKNSTLHLIFIRISFSSYVYRMIDIL